MNRTTPRRIALAIGIGNYDHYSQLNYSYHSVSDVFELLVSEKYGCCEPGLSRLVTDQNGEKITTIALNEIVENTLLGLEPDDRLIFYYTGHGQPIGDSLFLITSAAREPWHGLNFSAVVRRLADYNASMRTVPMLIVDACYSQSMFGGLKSWGEQMPDDFGFMASAGHFQMAMPIDESKRTIFSYFFCQGIQTGCGQFKGTETVQVTLPALSGYINQHVDELYGGFAQKSRVISTGDSQDLWIAKLGPDSPPPPAQTGNKLRLVASVYILDVFNRDYVREPECDEVLEYLAQIKKNLRYDRNTIKRKFGIEKKIDTILARTRLFRSICQSGTAEADAERRAIRSALLTLFQGLRKL